LLVLGPLPEQSVLWDGLRSLGAASHCATIAARPYYFDCARPFDELMGRLSKHFRKNLRNCGNRLKSLPDVRFETSAGGPVSPALFDAFLQVEASGWKGERGTGSAIRLHEALLGFYGDLACYSRSGDGCEINALFADDRCIAAEFCLRGGAEYACLKIGYDEEYARFSPGHLLHARTLERCCRAPAVERYAQLSEAAWLSVWHPDTSSLRRAYVPLGGWTRPPLAALLRFRFGSGRRAARWLRARRGATRAVAGAPAATERPRG
jgi:CelD/BcsL family acetyltransferase involved in cellulose biosynthesis